MDSFKTVFRSKSSRHANSQSEPPNPTPSSPCHPKLRRWTTLPRSLPGRSTKESTDGSRSLPRSRKGDPSLSLPSSEDGHFTMVSHDTSIHLKMLSQYGHRMIIKVLFYMYPHLSWGHRRHMPFGSAMAPPSLNEIMLSAFLHCPTFFMATTLCWSLFRSSEDFFKFPGSVSALTQGRLMILIMIS